MSELTLESFLDEVKDHEIEILMDNGVYIDHSFTKIKDTMYVDFTRRFRDLGIEPITVKEKAI